jgi:hypothetical protein
MRAECPPELWEVVSKCLQKAPAARYADLGQLAQALASFAPERSRACIRRILWLTEDNRTSTIKSSLFTDSYDRVPTNPAQPRRRWLLAGVLASALGLGLGLFLMRGARGPVTVRVSSGVIPASSVVPAPEGASAIASVSAPQGASASPIVLVSNSAASPVESPPTHRKSAAPSPVTRSRARSTIEPESASAPQHQPEVTPKQTESRTPTAPIAPDNGSDRTKAWLMQPIVERK